MCVRCKMFVHPVSCFVLFAFQTSFLSFAGENKVPQIVKMVSCLLHTHLHFSTRESISISNVGNGVVQKLIRYLCKYATDPGFGCLIAKTTPTFLHIM